MSGTPAVSRSGALRRLAAGALGAWVCGRGIDGARAAQTRLRGSNDPGRPNLRTLQALVLAGGGPANYTTLTLIGAVAGPNAGTVVAALVEAFDAHAVKAFILTFDFVVADALRRLQQNGFVLPATPDPDPKDRKALLDALAAAGFNPATRAYDADTMLDRLVSPRVRVRITSDVDEKYGSGAAAAFREIARALIEQLQARG